ncbi:hypothetical protein EXIGLDRAFT_503712 [Exidia glandulosa HHB12029]|uniref:Uncharacterized protein n=1 Tax=Exidia glandulosa HHB12029 TaxID=1314781 RepID=A0A165JD57_EXIGL|nr:hypothetical protein EXIGLDRAFT_503712 [Exidia glandulosa HHB12029]
MLAGGSIFGIGAIPVLKRSNSKDKKPPSPAKTRPARPTSPLAFEKPPKDLLSPPLQPPRPPGLMMGLSAPPQPVYHKPPSVERSPSLKLPPKVHPVDEQKPRRRLSLSALIHPAPLRKKSVEALSTRPSSPADSMWTARTTSTRPTTYAPSIDSRYEFAQVASIDECAMDVCDRESSPSSASEAPHPPTPSSTHIPARPLPPKHALSPKLRDLMLGEPLRPLSDDAMFTGRARKDDRDAQRFVRETQRDVHMRDITVFNTSLPSTGPGWTNVYAAAQSYDTPTATPLQQGAGVDFAQYQTNSGGGGGLVRKREDDNFGFQGGSMRMQGSVSPLPPMQPQFFGDGYGNGNGFNGNGNGYNSNGTYNGNSGGGFQPSIGYNIGPQQHMAPQLSNSFPGLSSRCSLRIT